MVFAPIFPCSCFACSKIAPAVGDSPSLYACSIELNESIVSPKKKPYWVYSDSPSVRSLIKASTSFFIKLFPFNVLNAIITSYKQVSIPIDYRGRIGVCGVLSRFITRNLSLHGDMLRGLSVFWGYCIAYIYSCNISAEVSK
jgi:hypothetical protein